jgi:hypothetical protein
MTEKEKNKQLKKQGFDTMDLDYMDTNIYSKQYRPSKTGLWIERQLRKIATKIIK